MANVPSDSRGGLVAAYRELLASSGLDLALHDKEPDKWPELLDGEALDPRAARQAIRMLENQRRYASFDTVGTEPEADYLYRLAVVGTAGGPYTGEGLGGLQKALDNQMLELRGWLASKAVRLPYEVFAGVFPTGEFNARAHPAPPWGALLLVNSGLMDLMFTVIKTNLASSFGSQDPPLLSESQVARVLAEAFNAYLYSESSTRSWGLPELPKTREGNLGFVLRRAEQFVIAHEVGHVVLGHVSMSMTVPHTVGMELDADAFASILLAASLNSPIGPVRDDEATYIGGAVMTFLIVAIAIEGLEAGLGIEQRNVPSHPDTVGRAAALRTRLRQDLPGENPLGRADVFSNWLRHFMPEVLSIIKEVNRVMKRPPYIKSW